MHGWDEQTFDLTAKRPNWDLKRDVEVKVGKLQHKLDRAIVELIRKKILEEKEVASKK